MSLAEGCPPTPVPPLPGLLQKLSLAFSTDQGGGKLRGAAITSCPSTAGQRARLPKRPGNPAVVYEDGLTERTVITEYPSLEKATASYGVLLTKKL